MLGDVHGVHPRDFAGRFDRAAHINQGDGIFNVITEPGIHCSTTAAGITASDPQFPHRPEVVKITIR
jgi:hypothetical protein